MINSGLPGSNKAQTGYTPRGGYRGGQNTSGPMRNNNRGRGNAVRHNAAPYQTGFSFNSGRQNQNQMQANLTANQMMINQNNHLIMQATQQMNPMMMQMTQPVMMQNPFSNVNAAPQLNPHANQFFNKSNNSSRENNHRGRGNNNNRRGNKRSRF